MLLIKPRNIAEVFLCILMIWDNSGKKGAKFVLSATLALPILLFLLPK